MGEYLAVGSRFWRRYFVGVVGGFALIMLGLHWVHLWADPSWKMGFLTGRDWSGDFFTDEGWEAKGAVDAVLNGHWYAPGEINLAVESPLWPALLYLPFKFFGVSLALARGIAMAFYALSVLGVFLFIKRLTNVRDAVLVAALLSVNVLGFTFGRATLVEPVFICFVILALVTALYAADASSFALALLSGLLLSLALLVKLTAAFAVVPLVAILWIRWKEVRSKEVSSTGNSSKETGKRLPAILLALASVALFPLLQHFLLIEHYPQDQQSYLRLNVANRRVTGPSQWLSAVAHIFVGLRAVGPFLLLAFLAGTALFLLQRRHLRHQRHNDPLLQLGWIWLLAAAAIFSTVHYFPPRYCLTLLFPISFLTVRYASLLFPDKPRSGLAIYALLALSIVINSAEDLRTLARPRYTMVALANQVETSLPNSARHSACPIMSFMGDTLALYTALPAANLSWAEEPTWQNIKACNPSLFVTREAVDNQVRQQFLLAGKTLELRESYKPLNGYAGSQPELLYTVKPLAVTR